MTLLTNRKIKNIITLRLACKELRCYHSILTYRTLDKEKATIFLWSIKEMRSQGKLLPQKVKRQTSEYWSRNLCWNPYCVLWNPKVLNVDEIQFINYCSGCLYFSASYLKNYCLIQGYKVHSFVFLLECSSFSSCI